MLEIHNENISENNKQKTQDNKIEKNPNFKFDSYIFYLSTNKKQIEEIFVSYNNNSLYIIGIDGKEHNILLIFHSIDNLNFKKILTIKDDKETIGVIRYFYNPQDNSEYLVSAHRGGNIFIYDIVNNFKKKYIINVNDYYDDCLLFFANNVIKNNYIYISSCERMGGWGDYNIIKEYSLDNKYIRTLEEPEEKNIKELVHLLFWHDKINDKYFIITITARIISINNLLDGKIYTTYENFINKLFISIRPRNGGYGFIYKDKYLITSYGDMLKIWDLYNKNLYKNIKIFIDFAFIVNWNNNYTIALSLNDSFYKDNYSKYEIIDIEQGKIITIIKRKEEKTIRFAKVLYHPIYGESFIIADESFKGIQLFSSVKIQNINFEKEEDNLSYSEEDKNEIKAEQKI